MPSILDAHSDTNTLLSSSYSVFRRVVGYYSDDIKGGAEGEDAFDMRKPLARDKAKKHIRENGEDFRVSPEDVW
jgi:N-terminal acetyltransferase B complex catalytic subunit